MRQALARRLRGWIAKLQLPARGSRIAFGTALYLDPKASIQCGRSTVVRRHGTVLIERGGAMCLGARTAIMQGADIVVAARARLSVGSSVYIGAYCNIRCGFSIDIADGVRLAQFVSLIDSNYEFRRRDVAIAGAVPGRVTIGRGAWLGAQVVVLPDVTIGEGAVVGAGSVVTKDVPAFAIVGGNPARVLGVRA